MERVLDVREITKYYINTNFIIKALDCVSFRVARGEFTAILGASASGKSTLLNIIATIDRASAGEIFIGGIRITNQKENRLAALRRDRLGFIFRDYNFLDSMTIEENIALSLFLQRENPRVIREKLHCIAEILGITGILSSHPQELSIIQRQYAACARAIITQPALILADEPTGALDGANSQALMETFQQMHAHMGATILMATHDPQIASYARRILFLKDGRLSGEILRGERTNRALLRDIRTFLASREGNTTSTHDFPRL